MGGPMPSLVSGKQLQHRGRQQVRRRVPVNFQRLGILRGQNLQFGVGFERPRQIVKLAVDPRDHGVVGQPRTDRFRDIHRPCASRNCLFTAIRQGDFDALTH